MKRTLATLLAVTALVTATACGASEPVGFPTPSASGTPPTRTEPAIPPTRTPVDFPQLSTKPGPGPETGIVPWTLVKTDLKHNRIYLSAVQSNCTVPSEVYLTETAHEIHITVAGVVPSSDHCTQQKTALIGYVQPLDPIDNRPITGSG